MKKLTDRRDEEGFTLIELLIVVIILGILAAVVAFGVSTLREDSVEKACKTDRKNVETAVAAYIAKNKKAPTETADGAAPTGLTPDYLRSYPASSDDYRIVYDNPSGTNYTVTAEKPGATAGTWADWAACA